MYLFIGKCAICSGWNICPLTRSLRDFIEGNLSEDRCNCFKFQLLNRKNKNFHYIVGPGGAQPLLSEAIRYSPSWSCSWSWESWQPCHHVHRVDDSIWDNFCLVKVINCLENQSADHCKNTMITIIDNHW